MSTRYLWIRPVNDPFPLGQDENDRVMFVFNVQAECLPTEQFEEELAGLLENANVGTFGTDIFAGPKAKIPTGNGPYTLISPSGGASPLDTQNEIGSLHRPSAQIVVRAASYSTARTKVWDAHAALNIRNTTVTAT